MIAANEAVARLLAERGVPALHRVHERPDPARAERLVAQLASLGVATPPVHEHDVAVGGRRRRSPSARSSSTSTSGAPATGARR